MLCVYHVHISGVYVLGEMQKLTCCNNLIFIVVSDYCTVELVGSIEVMGNTATYAFRGVGSGITGYICKLNGHLLPDCK